MEEGYPVLLMGLYRMGFLIFDPQMPVLSDSITSRSILLLWHQNHILTFSLPNVYAQAGEVRKYENCFFMFSRITAK